MPPKGYKKFKGKAKEEMLVISRLMAISFHVDDYIYKNKPISLLEAKKYDEEIISLKLKCKDTRSLQVVEKLRIFMKSIIKEQSIERLHEDLTNIITETSVDKNPLTVISEDVENNITNNLTTDTNTELFGNRERQSSEINKIQDINKQKKISINTTNPVISATNSKKKQAEYKNIITSNNLILKLNDKSKENIENIDFVKVDFLAKPTNDKEQEKQDFVTLTTSNLQKHPEQEKYLQENQTSINITTETKNKEKQTKANKKITKNKTTAKNNIKTTNVINKELDKKSSNQVSQSKKKPMNISWVENIKHVREVSTDEHTDLQLQDSFWSNLDLPGIWNSDDFD